MIRSTGPRSEHNVWDIIGTRVYVVDEPEGKSMLTLHPEVADAVREGRPVVALESSLIAQGLPWPVNVDTAGAAEAAIRAACAVPATIAVWEGQPLVGLNSAQITALAQRPDVAKASRRDLAAVISQRLTAATTVAATMFLAHRAGIRLMATGGIGGVHRHAERTFDISSDLVELARRPVAVVCSGAKSILDLPRTLELLETLAVPVIGYRCVEFPAFYVRSCGLQVGSRVDSPEAAAELLRNHFELGGAGLVLAQPVPESAALTEEEFAAALERAEALAGDIRGPATTPTLLRHLAAITQGRTLEANRALVVANASLAAQVACRL